MAKSTRRQKAKKAAKTSAKVGAAVYGARLEYSARRARTSAIRGDIKRVGKVAGKAANTRAGRKVGNSKAAVGTAIVGRRAADKAIGTVAKNPKKSAAVAVGAGVAATVAYKKRKTIAKGSKKAAKATGRGAKKTGKAYGRQAIYGSTRYTSQGAKKGSRFKGAVTVAGYQSAGMYGGAAAGAAVGAGIGKLSGKKDGAKLGAAIGGYAGLNAGMVAGARVGRKSAVKSGYIRKTKDRMSVRAARKLTGAGTYKRKLRSGKTITVRKGRRK